MADWGDLHDDGRPEGSDEEPIRKIGSLQDAEGLLPELVNLIGERRILDKKIKIKSNAHYLEIKARLKVVEQRINRINRVFVDFGLVGFVRNLESKGISNTMKELGFSHTAVETIITLQTPEEAKLVKVGRPKKLPPAPVVEVVPVVDKSDVIHKLIPKQDVSEEQRLFHDFKYFCSRAIHIQYRPGMNKEFPDGGYGPFRWTSGQNILAAELLNQAFGDEKPVRLIILKSRQLGCTTLLLAFWVWMCLTHPHFKIMFIIDKSKHNATKRFMILKWFEEIEKNFDCFPSVEKRADAFVAFTNGSMILFESAESPNPGTSEMIHALHESEKPKWPSTRALEVKQSILPGIPRAKLTFHVNESTAEGMDQFYVEWERANLDVNGTEGYTPIFLPWYVSLEYAMDVPQKAKDPLGRFVYLDEDVEVSEYDEDGRLSYTEQEYAKKYKLSPEQVYWRRIKIKIDFHGDRNTFDQEYPTTPAHAWRGVSFGFFPSDKLDQALSKSVVPAPFLGLLENRVGFLDYTTPCLYTQVDPVFRADRLGKLHIWDKPVPGKRYFLGGDVAEGKTVLTELGNTEPDRTIFSVKDETGRTMALYRSQDKPEEEWPALLLLARYYNDAYVNVEKNGPGATLLSWFYQTGYNHNLIWPVPKGRPVIDRTWTRMAAGQRTRPLSDLRASYNANYSIIRSRELLEELRAFIVDARTGKPGARKGAHDDIIFAEMYAEMCRMFILGTKTALFGEEVEEPAEAYDPTRDPASPKFAGFRIEDTDFEDLLDG